MPLPPLKDQFAALIATPIPPRESEAPPKVTHKVNQMYLPPRMPRREEHA